MALFGFAQQGTVAGGCTGRIVGVRGNVDDGVVKWDVGRWRRRRATASLSVCSGRRRWGSGGRVGGIPQTSSGRSSQGLSAGLQHVFQMIPGSVRSPSQEVPARGRMRRSVVVRWPRLRLRRRLCLYEIGRRRRCGCMRGRQIRLPRMLVLHFCI